MIRPMTQADTAAAAEIAALSMPQPWTRAAFAQELQNAPALLLTAEENGSVCGYISLQRTPDDAELTGIAVLPEMRRRGLASLLLQEARASLALDGISRIVLEVRVSNEAALRFYEKNGFHTIGIRKGFYDCPREDAAVMTDTKEDEDD